MGIFERLHSRSGAVAAMIMAAGIVTRHTAAGKIRVFVIPERYSRRAV